MRGIIELIQKQIDAEKSASEPIIIPEDFYVEVCNETFLLQKYQNQNNSELTNSLVSKQKEILASILDRLIKIRIEKALKTSPEHLLPEERSIYNLVVSYDSAIQILVSSIVEGKKSQIFRIRKKESERKVVLRFLREVGEIIGTDMERYGPFKSGDVAVLPAQSAKILISNNDAMELFIVGQE